MRKNKISEALSNSVCSILHFALLHFIDRRFSKLISLSTIYDEKRPVSGSLDPKHAVGNFSITAR